MGFLSLFAFLGFIIYLCIGIHAFTLNRNSILNRLFLLLCVDLSSWVFVSIFMYSNEDVGELWLWYKIETLASCLFAVIILNYTLVLTKNFRIIKSIFTQSLLILIPIFIIAEIFSRGQAEIFVVKCKYGIWILHKQQYLCWMNFAYIAICAILSLCLVIYWFHQCKLPTEKRQAKIILVCIFVFIVCSLIVDILLPALGIYIFPKMSSILALVWILGLWHSLTESKSIDANSLFVSNEILTKISDLIIMISKNGEIIKVNNNVLELLGFKKNEIMGNSVQNIILNGNVSKYDFFDNLKQVTNEMNFDVYLKAKNNNLISACATVIKIVDMVGELLGYLFVAQDIRQTKQLQKEIEEKKEIEAELFESNEKLKELDKIKTDFLSMISHEFRTPLTSILGFSKIINKKLQMVVLPGICETDKKTIGSITKMVENVDIIVVEGEKLTLLINDVLDIAKMESGNIQWEMKQISMIDVVEAALDEIDQNLLTGNIVIVKNYFEKDCIIEGNYERLVQVAQRIILNALKFTQEGSINIRVFISNNEVIVSVIDTGIGVSDEDIERIFEKFKQIGDTLTNKPQGTGLGLAICKQIIDHHNGRIWAESRLNIGSSFSFALPKFFQNSDIQNGD